MTKADSASKAFASALQPVPSQVRRLMIGRRIAIVVKWEPRPLFGVFASFYNLKSCCVLL